MLHLVKGGMHEQHKKNNLFHNRYFNGPIYFRINYFVALKSEDYERYMGFWGSIYLLIYILFPVVYRSKVAEKVSNKYIMFLILYLIAAIILLLLI